MSWNVKESVVWDCQGSEPYTTPDGEVRYRDYVNVNVHVLAPTMERAIELVREWHPAIRMHQVIKRTRTSTAIVDPNLFADAPAPAHEMPRCVQP